jgi:hypothetical protein
MKRFPADTLDALSVLHLERLHEGYNFVGFSSIMVLGKSNSAGSA